MTASIWQRRDGRDAIDGLEVDAAVIGGGITGISAAMELERRGARVCILEKHAIAAGASGRNAGYLMRGLAESYAAAAEQFGRSQAAELWRWTEANLRALRDEGIERTAGYRAQLSTLVAIDDEEAEQLRRSAAMLREDGFEAALLSETPHDPDNLWRTGLVRCALVNPADAICHPVRLIEHLAATLRESTIQTHTEVVAIEATGSGVTLRTSRGVVRAGSVLIAANAYASAFRGVVGDLVRMRRAQMLAFLPVDPATRLDHAYYANRGNEYFRQLDDGRVIVGGMRRFEPEDEAGHAEGTCEAVQSALRAFIERIAGPVVNPEAWSGAMGFTPSGLPYAGRVGDGPLWFCGGFTGHGMSMGFITARAVARAMLGDPIDLPRAIQPPPVPAIQ